MTDDLRELMQRELDGENSPAASLRLQQQLADDPAAARELEGLRDAVAALQSLEEEDPPAWLRGNLRVQANRTEGKAMSKKGLVWALGIVVVAAVVGYFGFVEQPGEGEVTGAIGAVEKHRADQIDDQDVVLGGEEPGEDYVAWGDVLTDGATLQSMSTELEAISAGLGAMTLDAKAAQLRLGAFSDSLDSHKLALLARFDLGLRDQLGAAKRLLEARSMSLDAKIQQGLQEELGAISASLDAKSMDLSRLESARMRLEAFNSDLDAKIRLNAMSLEAANLKLEAMRTGLESKSMSLDARSLATMRDELGAISDALGAKSFGLEARMQRLNAMSLEARSLAKMQGELGKGIQLGAMTLGNMSKEMLSLGSRLEADSLGAMKMRLESFSLEQRTLLGMRDSLDASIRALGAMSLDARAMQETGEGFDAAAQRLQARMDLGARRLTGEMKFQLGATNKLLDNKSIQLRAMSLDALGSHLGSLRGSLGARELGLEAGSLRAMEDQLGASSMSLENRKMQLGAMSER